MEMGSIASGSSRCSPWLSSAWPRQYSWSTEISCVIQRYGPTDNGCGGYPRLGRHCETSVRVSGNSSRWCSGSWRELRWEWCYTWGNCRDRYHVVNPIVPETVEIKLDVLIHRVPLVDNGVGRGIGRPRLKWRLESRARGMQRGYPIHPSITGRASVVYKQF